MHRYPNALGQETRFWGPVGLLRFSSWLPAMCLCVWGTTVAACNKTIRL